jgi:hypothetical protein
LGQASIGLPPLPEGEYFAIVHTDRRRQVAADANRDNNLAVSLIPIALSVPELDLDVPMSDSFAAPNEDRFYQVTVAAGETLVLDLDSAAAGEGVELYARFGALPTPHEFDFGARDPQADQSLTIPETQAGVYFVLARSKFGDAAADDFTLTASIPGFGVRSISPTSSANEGQTTVAIRGTDLSANTTASLKLGVAALAATTIDFQDPSLLFATFDLIGQAAGVYDVQLSDGQQTAILSAAFAVTENVVGTGQIFLTAPEFVRIGRTGRVLVEWINPANVDLPAPQLQLTAEGATLRLEEQAQFVGGTLEFLGSSDSGPPDVIRPGQRLSRYVVSRLRWR